MYTEKITKKQEKSTQSAELSPAQLEANEYSKILVAKLKEKGINIYHQVNAFAMDMENKYGREKMLKNRLYHALIGSTIWPGLELEEDEEIGGQIKDFINNL